MKIKEICIQGLGFVGIATATVIASIKDSNGKPKYNVIGVELKNTQGLKKINLINQGKLYFQCDDKSFKDFLKESVIINKNFRTTTDDNVYKDADVVVIAINMDVNKNRKNYFKSRVLIENFENAIITLGKKIRSDCLIITETTIPIGTSQSIIEKIIQEEFTKRGIISKPLICHSPERVMPGKNYLDSIINYWRNFSANSEQAKCIAEEFFNSIINTKTYPLTFFNDLSATEILKILENSYRAVNIAFIYEWTLLAEEIGINLFEVIDAIKKRKGTHDNIMKPGFGVGGYCLPKDALLAQWGLINIFQISQLKLNMSIEALQINDKMPLHTLNLIKKELSSIKGKNFLICGASYLPDVADLRNTPSKILYDAIKKERASCNISDPFIDDLESNFNQEDIIKDDDFTQYDVIIFAVRYQKYLNLNPEVFIKNIKQDVLIVDTFDIFTDEKIKFFLKKSINIIGVGKGHIKKLKKELK